MERLNGSTRQLNARRGRARRAAFAALLLCAAAPPLTARQKTDDAPRAVRVASTPQTLWLADVRAKGSRLFHRTALGDFDRGERIGERIQAMAADGEAVYLIFEDPAGGRLYRFAEKKTTRKDDLPDRALPLHMLALNGVLYAIVPTKTADALEPDEQAASQPAPSEPPPLTIVRYDGRRWTKVAPCPPSAKDETSPTLRPRLCVAKGDLFLFWQSAQADAIHGARLDLPTRRWIETSTISLPNATGFWIANVGPVLWAVGAVGDLQVGQRIVAFRLFDEWRPAALTLSSLPDDAGDVYYLEAFGFNQQLGLLCTADDGESYLRFAQVDVVPTEPTVRIGEIFERPEAAQRVQAPIQWLTLLLLIAVLTGLFVFRRGSMVQTVPLPAATALAPAFLRLIGFLVDIVPFALAADFALETVQLRSAIGALTVWGFGGDVEAGLPEPAVLLWWGLTCGGHTLYVLIMELITRRSVGKMLTGVRLISESGGRASTGQILARNAFRILELTPQFWILGFLVLISRNRQRLGDIFARTVSIRSTDDAPDESAAESADPGDDPPSESKD